MSKRDKIELKELESLPEALDGNHRVIPIVTGEDDTVEEVAVPEILPVLTLRSSVLFPGAITPVTVGRSRSMTLVRDTNARNGMLAAVLQRDGDVEEPKAEDMYRIGTAARIMKILEMPNGNLTVILNGLEKVEIGHSRRPHTAAPRKRPPANAVSLPHPAPSAVQPHHPYSLHWQRIDLADKCRCPPGQ